MARLPRPIRALMAAVTGAPGPDLQKFLDGCADMGENRCSLYALYQDYYDGEQNARLTDRARQWLENSGVNWCENFCEPVVDALADRLKVDGFTTSDAEDDDDEDPLVTLIKDWWQRNRMDDGQGTVHTETLIKGDGYVIVDWDNDRGIPRFTYNHPEHTKVVYSDERPDEADHAVKVWVEKGAAGRDTQRMNVYWPDRIEKWQRPYTQGARGGWTRFTEPADDGDPAPWPTPWTSAAGDPLGIPVVHFRNKPLARMHGRSEIKGTLPQQDELNKQIVDLNLVADNYGEPKRWATGVESFDDTAAIGDWVTATGDGAKFGQFEMANMANLVALVENTLSRIARRSRTPLHLLTGGDMPSGEALKSAEAGLVAKARDRMSGLGNSWEDVVSMGVRLAVEFGDLAAPPDGLLIQTVWHDPESRNEMEHLEAAVLKQQLGVSQHTLVAELGYDPVVEAELRKGEAEEAQEALGSFLDRGATGRTQ